MIQIIYLLFFPIEVNYTRAKEKVLRRFKLLKEDLQLNHYFLRIDPYPFGCIGSCHHIQMIKSKVGFR